MPGLGATDPVDLQAHARAQLPDIPFEKRIQQLQAFEADTGTLNIDHNYKHCSNLGGWVVEITVQLLLATIMITEKSNNDNNTFFYYMNVHRNENPSCSH